jgi:NAD(P)-dependent dehydrogenase (short-subunit alcohol dehydrogenase family)
VIKSVCIRYAAFIWDRRIIFVEIDVSVWESVLVLFETTLSHFGSIDAVYVNTGGAFEEGLLENELDAAGKLKGALDEEYGGQFARGCVHHQGCNLLLREGARENASASFDRLGSKVREMLHYYGE